MRLGGIAYFDGSHLAANAHINQAGDTATAIKRVTKAITIATSNLGVLYFHVTLGIARTPTLPLDPSPANPQQSGHIYLDHVTLCVKRVIVVHAFIKKSQQTPDRDLVLARKRIAEVQNGGF